MMQQMSSRAPVRYTFVNRYYKPDHSATSQLLTDLAEHLASLDWCVRVLSSNQLYQDADARLPSKEALSGVRIRRLAGTRFGRGASLGRAIDYLVFLFGATTWLVRNTRRTDVIIAKTDPPFLGMAALIAAKLRRASIVVWHQDIFPDAAYASDLGLPRFLRPVLDRVRNCIVRNAVANVAIGSIMAERLTAIDPRSRVTLIHNWAPFGVIQSLPPEANSLRKDWGFEGKFVVGYSGNMGRVHEFETILSAAAIVRNDPAIAFLLVGDGARRQELEDRIRTLGLENISMRPYQPLERLAESLSVPDVHLVTLHPRLEGIVVPSKFYGILAAGRPVIFVGDLNGEIARLVRQFECGLAIETGDAQQLASSVKNLASRPDTCQMMAEHALAASRANLGREHSLGQWVGMLKMEAKKHE